MSDLSDTARVCRRTFIEQTATGLGLMALSTLLPRVTPQAAAQEGRWRGVVNPPHVPPRAKRVIYLYMAGGPSHLESFDHKPELARRNGQPMPQSFTRGQPIAQLQGRSFVASGHSIRFGAAGGRVRRSPPSSRTSAPSRTTSASSARCSTEAINHDPGPHVHEHRHDDFRPARDGVVGVLRPGLATPTICPASCVLTSTGRFGQSQPIAARQWHSGFLPSRFQGIHLRGTGDPVLYLSNPPGIDAERQREVVDAVQQLNRLEQGVDRRSGDRHAHHAVRDGVPHADRACRRCAISPRSRSACSRCTASRGADGSFAANCLMARRLAERGVRFIQLYHRGWDHHGGVRRNMAGSAGEVDQRLGRPGHATSRSAACSTTRSSSSAASSAARRWRRATAAITTSRASRSGWPAPASRRGLTYGATDELGYNAVDNVVSVHDLHATMLHLLGIDHLRLTYRFQGRDFRLTDVSGEVVRGILS